MITTRWHEVDRLFQLAAERLGDERQIFLDAACGADWELRQEVESLLEADAGAVSLLDDAVAARGSGELAAGQLAVEPGDRIGVYRIRRLIGEGGMGAVFLAERDDERFSRQVAIKLLKQALFSPAALGRFHHECRVLARLEHVNVARLYDAGTTSLGVPYMVMEYLEGSPIDEYARGLGVEGILALFAEVCDAVAYAHRLLIVHRDLKPGNVLVTPEGTPKLLDFGIAKLLDATGASPTRTAAQPMTPRYASPEQRRGEVVATGTDVYSLGLILYELLTGTLPDDRGHLPPASTVVADGHLRRRLQGDLDTILQKALAIDAARRYPSVERFGDDLRRHLGGLPVLARRPTAAYRARRFVRRHAWPVAAALLFMFLLAGAAVTAGLFARDAARQRDRARLESASAREVTAFLVDLFRSSRPEEHRGREPKVHEILEKGAERLRRGLGESPEARAALFEAIGEAYLSLSRFDEAAALLESAVELRRQTLGDDHPQLAATRLMLANVELKRSHLERAEDLARRALEVLESHPGLDEVRRAQALDQLGAILTEQGKLEEAETDARRALALRRELFKPSDPEIGLSHLTLAGLFYNRNDWADAEASYREALAILDPAYGHDDPLVVTARHDLATVLQNLGDGDGALDTYKEILATQKRLYGPAHAEIAGTLNSLGTTYYDLGDYERAEESFRAAIDMRRRLDGEDTVDVGMMLDNLGRVVERRGRVRESVSLYQEALDILRQRVGAESPSLGLPQINLGRVLVRSGRAASAEELLRGAEKLFVASLGEDHYLVDMARVGLAECLMELGRRREAEELLGKSIEGLRRKLGPEHRLTRQASELMGKLRASSETPAPSAVVDR